MSDNPYEPPLSSTERNTQRFAFASSAAVQRIAAFCWLVAILTLPMHLFVSCSVSQGLGLAGMLTGAIAGLAELVYAPYRAWSFAVFGIGGCCLVILHPLFAH